MTSVDGKNAITSAIWPFFSFSFRARARGKEPCRYREQLRRAPLWSLALSFVAWMCRVRQVHPRRRRYLDLPDQHLARGRCRNLARFPIRRPHRPLDSVRPRRLSSLAHRRSSSVLEICFRRFGTAPGQPGNPPHRHLASKPARALVPLASTPMSLAWRACATGQLGCQANRQIPEKFLVIASRVGTSIRGLSRSFKKGGASVTR